jgi:hypothetical protein
MLGKIDEGVKATSPAPCSAALTHV